MMRQTNVASFQPVEVITIDGRTVLNDSEEWRLCCEAVYTLRMPEIERAVHLEKIEKKRGLSGREYLQEELDRVEPAFVLEMENKNHRRSYLAAVEQSRGVLVRGKIERAIVKLWEDRKRASDVR